MKPFEIFCTCPPGLEPYLQAEALEKGFTGAEVIPGGVRFAGLWPNVMRANLHLRGATKVLARIARAELHNLSQLERFARDIPWEKTLRRDVPVRVDASCKRSKINHAGAAKTRLERAMAGSIGVTVSADAPVTLMLRVENNKATFSVDTSGSPLHMRGTKEAVGKAPLRETMAALLLRAAGFDGQESVLDPMCGSGTFVLEAAEMAAGFAPGRSRSFAFEQLASFLPDHWARMKADLQSNAPPRTFYGSDRDAGAIENAKANATRAGLSEICTLAHTPISDLTRPASDPGLVIVNPPYGARIGDKKHLFALYARLGDKLRSEFSGWRAAILTTDAQLAYATKLDFTATSAPIPHGGLKVKLYQTGPL